MAPTSRESRDNPIPPQEPLEVEEGGISDEDIIYPTGRKLWLTMTSLCIACFLNGLVGSQQRSERMLD